MNIEPAKVVALWDYETSPLFSDAERAALRFAQAAGCVPNAVTDENYAELRIHLPLYLKYSVQANSLPHLGQVKL